MEQFDPRVDAYIAKSAPFAQPILEHIRQVVHETSPLITETMKWSMPFFDYKGTLCQMAAFKQHCAFGFWKASRLDDPDHLLNPGEESSAGSFGRISKIEDLPAPDVLKHFILQAMAINDGEKVVVKKAPVEKAATVIPDYFINFLSGHPKAMETFYNFSPSHKKEYVQWITEAKTEATRISRMEQAVEWMNEGKSRNWKYRR
jgi:uncharacterized protein YdeI (YjbR/CyaY-like superfamily)